MNKNLWNLTRLIISANSKKDLNLKYFNRLLQSKSQQLILIRTIKTTKPNLTNLTKSNLKVFYFIYNTLKYAFVFSATAGIGLLTGYSLSDNKNEETSQSLKPVEYQATRIIENKKKEFPLRLHLFQYESDAECAQIRAYLDYFGYEYKVTEVDSLAKNDQLSFTVNRKLPVLVFQHREKKQRWHLANSTAIISALESIRNEASSSNYAEILNKYLPVLRELRRWIDDLVQQVLRLNAVSSFKSLQELFDMYALKSDWSLRYGNKLKFYYAYYVNMLKTYLSVSQLRADFKLKTSSEFDLLTNQVIKKWENALNGNEFAGGSEPNLADLSMFACVKSYEQLKFMQLALFQNLKFASWYKRMKEKHEIGYVETLPVPGELPINESNPQSDEVHSETQSINIIDNVYEFKASKILAANYLIHVLAFTFARYMSSK